MRGAENSALPKNVDSVWSLVPAAVVHVVCLVYGAISIELIRSCFIVSSATTEKNPSKGHRQDGSVMNSTAKIALTQALPARL